MAGISDKALKMGYAENRYKYNGIEYDSSLGIDEYEAHYRDLDPQTGRWWQIDPEADKERESLSPYASMTNDPVFKTDPLGNEDEACCGGILDKVKSLARDVVIFSAAAANAWGTNQAGGAGRADVSTMAGLTDHDQQVAQLGQITGDAASVGTGALEVGSAGTGELATAGIATPVALAVGAHGVSSIATGISNLVKDFQKVNSKAEDRASKLNQTDRSRKKFTKAGKEAVKDLNTEKNGDQMKCENCGQPVQDAEQHTKGVTPPSNEAHVDHTKPKSKGGSGTPNNGKVLCRDCNLKKGAN
jgi:RHS repeat-associated protein